MKTIGLIGGMSWESTVTYYQVINTVIREKKGGLHSAKCVLYSVDFEEIEACQSGGNWEKAGQLLAQAAQSLEKAGADFLLICTNTMHKVELQVRSAVKIPVLHIADLTAEVLRDAGIERVGLLGTKYTMEQDFYKKRLIDHKIAVMLPSEVDRSYVNAVIFEELCKGICKPSSKQRFLSIVDQLRAEGAQGIILGCTEIGLLIRQCDTKAALFDTALIHAEKAALYALE